MTSYERYRGQGCALPAVAGSKSICAEIRMACINLIATLLMFALGGLSMARAQSVSDDGSVGPQRTVVLERSVTEFADRDWCWSLLNPQGRQRRFCADEHVAEGHDAVIEGMGGAYIQFGFIGCEACPRVASEMDAVLPSDIRRVYAHVDGIVATHELRGRVLWDAVRNYLAQHSEYAHYIAVVAVTPEYVDGFWESRPENLAWPVSVLIRVDGRLRIVAGGSHDMPQEMLQWWNNE